MATATTPITSKAGYAEATIRYPREMDFVFVPYDESSADSLFERNALMLYPYILREQISYGRAAAILGVSRWSLIEWYTAQGFVCMEITAEKLQSDMDNLSELGLLGG